jgi:hypothetical protein
MPIVITPSGEYVDSVTGNPVQMTTPPMDNMAQRLSQGMGQRNLDPGSVVREGEIPMSIEIDGQTRMMTPSEIAKLDSGSVVREGEMARENIPARDDMGMDSMMPAVELSDVDKVRMLIDMGLNPQEAMEAIAREKARPTIAPEEFGRVVGMEGGQQMADPMMREQQMGALPMARPTPPPMPMQRPFDLSNMSPEQRDMVRRGIDPFAEGYDG